LDFDATGTIREKGVNELDEFGIDWYIYEFLNQPVVPHLIEDPLYVEKNSESALLHWHAGLMVKRSDRNPNCSGGWRLLISRKFFTRLERIFSKIWGVATEIIITYMKKESSK
jgi:hypothetical protein